MEPLSKYAVERATIKSTKGPYGLVATFAYIHSRECVLQASKRCGDTCRGVNGLAHAERLNAFAKAYAKAKLDQEATAAALAEAEGEPCTPDLIRVGAALVRRFMLGGDKREGGRVSAPRRIDLHNKLAEYLASRPAGPRREGEVAHVSRLLGVKSAQASAMLTRAGLLPPRQVAALAAEAAGG